MWTMAIYQKCPMDTVFLDINYINYINYNYSQFIFNIFTFVHQY